MKSLVLAYLLLSVPSAYAQGGAMKRILIVYGSQKGSTAEIAGRMQGYLNEADFSVDTLAAYASTADFSKYDLVIIGSGIYGGQPHKKIKAFIDINRSALSQKKVAVFAVCGMMCSPDEKKRSTAMAFSGKVACGLSPLKQTVFAGKMAPSGWLGNLILKWMWGATPGDHRDWDRIKAWTLALGELIK